MTTMTVENEIFELEGRYWEAIRDRDLDAILELSDDPSIVAGASGATSLSREQLGKMMANANWRLQRFELKDPVVRLLRDDVALCAYRVHEELTVDGRPVQLDAYDASTWVRRSTGWMCALHSEALKGDAFGRDRKG